MTTEFGKKTIRLFADDLSSWGKVSAAFNNPSDRIEIIQEPFPASWLSIGTALDDQLSMMIIAMAESTGQKMVDSASNWFNKPFRGKIAELRRENIPVLAVTNRTNTALEKALICDLGFEDCIVWPDSGEQEAYAAILRKRCKSILNRFDDVHDQEVSCYSRKGFFSNAGKLLSRQSGKPGYDVIMFDITNVRTVLEQKRAEGSLERNTCQKLFFRQISENLKTLHETIRGIAPGCTYGRYSETMFVFLVPNTLWQPRRDTASGPAEAVSVSERIRQFCRILTNGYDTCEVHAGICSQVSDIVKACNLAIDALDRIASDKSRTFCIIDKEERQLRESIEEAFAEGQIVPFFQPKVDPVTRELCGAEALARWNHPVFKTLGPHKFVRLMAETGNSKRLDLTIWRKVAQAQKKWMDQGLPIVPVSVNFERWDFSASLGQELLDIVQEVGIDPGQLHVEIKETEYSIDRASMRQYLDDIRQKGFHIEMDDFGQENSTLTELGAMPVDVLKLDKAFFPRPDSQPVTEEPLWDTRSAQVVAAVISMAHALGMTTVAEGVDQGMKKLNIALARAGCDCIQGYYYGKPMSEEAFEKQLQKIRTQE